MKPKLLALTLFLISQYAFAQSAINILYPNGSGGQIAVSASNPLPTTASGTGSVITSGTTETPVFAALTSGTTVIAAGTYSIQLLPSVSATGSIICTSGTFALDGNLDSFIPIAPGKQGNFNPQITVVITSGTVRRLH